MLCLRRISLDAKSRLLFLSRSHSSTNDSMPKSTAISRLIHKRFLQQNGNNSPQAIFVFFQQRGVRTKVPEDTDKSAEFKFDFDPSGTKLKDEWEERWYRRLEESYVKSGKSEEEFEKKLKEINTDMYIDKFLQFFSNLVTSVAVVFMIYIFGPLLVIIAPNYFASAILLLLELGGNFLIRLVQVLASLVYTVRTAFERLMTKVLKTNDKSVRPVKVPDYYLKRGVVLALVMFIVSTMLVRPNLTASIVLFTVLQALSYFGVLIYFRMTYGRKGKPKPSTALLEYDMKSGSK